MIKYKPRQKNLKWKIYSGFNLYKKLKNITIGKNVRTVRKNAVFKCPALKTVNIKSTLLTKKTASKKGFKSVNKKLVIKVPKKVKKLYTKIFKGLKIK